MPSPEIDLATFEELKQMSGADFISELIETFLEDAPQLIKDMKTSLKSNDAEVFRRAAHSFKSNSATFGANRLSILAKELEMLGRENKLNEIGSRLESLEEAYGAAAKELKDLEE
jgi:HPt (histidine-containing phosphotransfer) domain-containing protein